MRYALPILALLVSAAFGFSPDSLTLPVSCASIGATTLPAPTPTTSPTTQPTTKPTTKPTTQPTSGPTSGPTSQPTSGPATRPTTSATATSKAASQPTSKPAEPKDKYFAITGGVVHPVSGPTVRGVTILCKNGKIQAIGRHLNVPDGAETLDASGMHVYPGLVASSTRGIVGSEPPEDTTNVFGTNLRLANAGGLTTVVTGNTAAKATFGSIDGMLLRKNLFITLRYRRSPERRKVREALDAVRVYLRDKEAFDKKKAAGDKEAKPPDEGPVKGSNAKYLQLLKREKAAVISADSREALIAICDLANDYGIRIVVRGATEGWSIAGRLGRAGIKAIVTPRRVANRDERRNQPTGNTVENAAILWDHGVDVAVTMASSGISLGGIGGRDLLNLPMEAAYAVRGGMPEPAAIESITLTAARILGIDDRVGSIEIGKDADFIICDGKLLEFYTTVQWTVVNGRTVYDKAEETLFADIRPRTPSTQPAKYKFWPRPFKPKPAPEQGEGRR